MNRPAALPAVVLFLASCSSTPPAGPASPSASSSAAASASGSASAAPSSTAAAGASGSASAGPSASAAPVAPPLPPVALVVAEPVKSAAGVPRLGILSPAKSQIVPSGKAALFDVRVSAAGWKPAQGDHVCVVLDKASCKRVPDTSKPIQLGELGTLEPGQHVLSVLARHATGEFFRSSGKSVPFASVSFFVGKKVPLVHKDSDPMLFYSPPESGPAPADGVVIDFFVANAEIAEGKYIVTASVGGPGIETGVGLAVKENKPLRLQNARPGEYVSRLTLLHYVASEIGPAGSKVSVTYTAKPVETPFGEVMRSLFVLK